MYFVKSNLTVLLRTEEYEVLMCTYEICRINIVEIHYFQIVNYTKCSLLIRIVSFVEFVYVKQCLLKITYLCPLPL